MLKIYVAVAPNCASVLSDISNLLGGARCGMGFYPDPLWIDVHILQAETVRELIREQGLTIVKEEMIV